MDEIFYASVKNVNELRKAKKETTRLANSFIRNNEEKKVHLLTYFHALTYSSLTEAEFLKTINIPHGFDDDLIQQITSQKSLEEKWEKCIELSFRKISRMKNSGEVQNKKKKIKSLIKKYIIEHSYIRNKIAHGQWNQALNRHNTSINENITKKINNIDFVKIDVLFEIYEKISQVMRDLIESPNKAHFRDFYLHLSELDTLIDKKRNWTLESKIRVINEKYKNNFKKMSYST